MTLRIDSRWPLVWRDPHTLQVGIDPPRVVLERVTQLEERLVSALTVGVTPVGLEVIASGNRAVTADLLRRLAPVLQAPTPRSLGATVAISGSGRLVHLTAGLLGEAGIRVVVSASSSLLVDADPELAVVVGHGVVAPEAHGLWLRRDIPHLPVLFTESAVHLGPGVEPGNGPCLVCIELHRRDDDAAWPTIATQLLWRSRSTEPPALATEAAAAACRMVIDRLENGAREPYSVRIATNGERTRTRWLAHPECTCGGVEGARNRVPQESDLASATPGSRLSLQPTTTPSSAGRA